ncbi:MAG TPA: DUF4097 family beta strand repeat-containing protein [Candidatus Didemnitutus sp.]|nr:DUF4097 family beta strand repeat-containing protein [Candidatus Didemnitutus sp.]
MKSLLRSLCTLAPALAFAAICSAHVSEAVHEKYPLTANGTVHLENVNGTVVIEAWDKPEVALEAEKTAPDDDYLKLIHIVVDSKPDEISIKTEYEKKHTFFGDTRGEVTYHLKVPSGATLKGINVVNSDIEVRGVTAWVDLKTVNGKIDATGLTAGGHFDTVNGSISVSFSHVSSAISLNTVNGSCRVKVPKDSAFSLKASSVNGNTTCDLPVTLEKSGHHHLRGTVGGGGPEVSLSSVNGSLAISSS